MNGANVPLLAALLSSAIASVATIATTWLVQRHQERVKSVSLAFVRRERLYDAFIDEATQIFGDALNLSARDLGKLVKLYAIHNKLRLFAPTAVLEKSDSILVLLAGSFSGAESGDYLQKLSIDHLDILREFSDACRKDLGFPV